MNTKAACFTALLLGLTSSALLAEDPAAPDWLQDQPLTLGAPSFALPKISPRQWVTGVDRAPAPAEPTALPGSIVWEPNPSASTQWYFGTKAGEGTFSLTNEPVISNGKVFLLPKGLANRNSRVGVPANLYAVIPFCMLGVVPPSLDPRIVARVPQGDFDPRLGTEPKFELIPAPR